jgi:hypothetical protein
MVSLPLVFPPIIFTQTLMTIIQIRQLHLEPCSVFAIACCLVALWGSLLGRLSADWCERPTESSRSLTIGQWRSLRITTFISRDTLDSVISLSVHSFRLFSVLEIFRGCVLLIYIYIYIYIYIHIYMRVCLWMKFLCISFLCLAINWTECNGCAI